MGRTAKKCISVEIFVDWIANHNPPWAANRAFMSGRLVALEKRPGLCLVGFRETWQRLFGKCMLRVMGPKSTNMCQDDQLYVGLKVGIYRDVNGVQYIFCVNSSIEYLVFLLLYSKNASNEINQIRKFGRFNIYIRPELVYF